MRYQTSWEFVSGGKEINRKSTHFFIWSNMIFAMNYTSLKSSHSNLLYDTSTMKIRSHKEMVNDSKFWLISRIYAPIDISVIVSAAPESRLEALPWARCRLANAATLVKHTKNLKLRPDKTTIPKTYKTHNRKSRIQSAPINFHQNHPLPQPWRQKQSCFSKATFGQCPG